MYASYGRGSDPPRELDTWLKDTRIREGSPFVAAHGTAIVLYAAPCMPTHWMCATAQNRHEVLAYRRNQVKRGQKMRTVFAVIGGLA